MGLVLYHGRYFNFQFGDELMQRALVIEDSIPDQRRAMKVFKALQWDEIQQFIRVDAALLHMQEVVEGKHPVPELIILDLQFNLESGFEVLRFLKSNPIFCSVPVIVWTHMGTIEQELSRYFGATVVSKEAGSRELEGAVKNIRGRFPQPKLTGS